LAQSAADLVDQFIETGRYALLLDPQTAAHLTDRQRERVIDIVETSMSIVPEGQVLVGVSAERASWGGTSVKATSDGVKRVDGFYIDRFAVTNAEFQHFVDAGVYEDFSLWPEEALPALFEFVDQTGNAGPRYWIDGHHDPALATHPVVGISWYEASAYARWVGKRLLTDAEWTKAAAWPVETTPGRIMQRRYPWGDSFESRRANLWNSSSGGTVSVEQYQHGSTLGGVYQLIGNVWEWTSDEFTEGCDINGHESFRTLHGGAFNTYFENQATCHFRSGEMPLARRDNVGFRLALSINTLEPQEDLESLELLPVLVD
jgi:iron(II)-dependent oxidoreductase